MYKGGVRVAVVDNGKLLMVKQRHEGRDIWMLPGGGIEDGETSVEAAERELMEETKLEIKVGNMLWFVEELRDVKNEGVNLTQQRFVAFFKGERISGIAELGEDPEFDQNGQVLEELAFISRDELMNKEKIRNLYPEWLREEVDLLFEECDRRNPYRRRK